jgi:hypothetical protein
MHTPFSSILKVAFFIGFVFFSLSIYAQSAELSPDAEITLLTASPGNELYSVFGHSAIRVIDTDNNIDLVFNYGTFDFNTPNFYVKFVRGKLLYKLSVVPMEYFLAEYRYEGRAVYEQVLDLTFEQKQRLFDFLMVNRLPENAYYHYDFFYDNCATRIRDIIDLIVEPEWATENEITPEAVAGIRSILDYEFQYSPEVSEPRTFRDLLQPYLINMPWSKFGIDLALGLPTDKIASAWDFMYLPEEMLIAFALATHEDGRSLTSEYRIILPIAIEADPAPPVLPQYVFWVLFLISIALMVNPRRSLIFDKTLFSVLGITGVIIIFLWFFTDHISTKTNLNILWAIPTHLYFIWFTKYENMKSSARFYFRMITLLSLGLILMWPFVPQDYHPAFFPIVLIVLIKSATFSFEIPVVSGYLRKGGCLNPKQRNI